MLRVTIEMVSAVDQSRNKIMGIAEIALDREMASQTKGKFGSYQVSLSKWAPMHNQIWKSGHVERFDRQKRGPWDLLYLALKNIVGSRNK